MSFAGYIEGFTRIDVEAIGEVAFTNRLEIKFVLSEDQLPELMRLLSECYSLVTVSEKLISDYTTQYYDTENFGFYFAHHNHRTNRYKVRQRTYKTTGDTFLEVKYQSGNTKVAKARIRRAENAGILDQEELDFLTSKLPIRPESLLPTLQSSYQRITLINSNYKERITVDRSIGFSDSNTFRKLNHVVIIELKQAKKQLSPAFVILKKMGSRPVSISKYCLGINYLYPSLKQNNFKQRLNAINKITHNGAFLNTITG